jgi:hypothetical protein
MSYEDIDPDDRPTLLDLPMAFSLVSGVEDPCEPVSSSAASSKIVCVSGQLPLRNPLTVEAGELPKSSFLSGLGPITPKGYPHTESPESDDCCSAWTSSLSVRNGVCGCGEKGPVLPLDPLRLPDPRLGDGDCSRSTLPWLLDDLPFHLRSFPSRPLPFDGLSVAPSSLSAQNPSGNQTHS